MTKKPSFILDVVGACLAGAGLWTAFPALSWWWMTVPALALLFSRVDRASTGRTVLISAIFAAMWWFPLISWVPDAVGGCLPWVALAITQILAIILWGLSVRVASLWSWSASVWGQCLVYALTWVGVEQLRSHYPWTGFPWGNVAMPQVDSPLGHVAPLGGEVLVSAVVVCVSVLIGRAVAVSSTGVEGAWFSRPALLGLAVALFTLPAFLPLGSAQEDGALRVGVAQGDISLPGVEAFSHEGEVSGNHRDVTKKMGEGGVLIDLVVWGETAADRDPRHSDIVAANLREASAAVSAPILFGFGDVEDDLWWNRIGVWQPGEGLDESTIYAKQRPVPFGEFIPFRSIISVLATEAAQVSVDTAAATEPGIMSIRLADGREVEAAVGICFESAYPQVIGEGVRLGGEFIVTPSNNYYFLSSPESAQQAQLLRFRAMEFSRAAIQASTTGMSAIIRPDGSIQAFTQPQTADEIVAEIPLRTSLTPAAVLGEVPADAVMAAWGVLVLVSAVEAARRRRVGARTAKAGATRAALGGSRTGSGATASKRKPVSPRIRGGSLKK